MVRRSGAATPDDVLVGDEVLGLRLPPRGHPPREQRERRAPRREGDHARHVGAEGASHDDGEEQRDDGDRHASPREGAVDRRRREHLGSARPDDALSEERVARHGPSVESCGPNARLSRGADSTWTPVVRGFLDKDDRQRRRGARRFFRSILLLRQRKRGVARRHASFVRSLDEGVAQGGEAHPGCGRGLRDRGWWRSCRACVLTSRRVTTSGCPSSPTTKSTRERSRQPRTACAATATCVDACGQRLAEVRGTRVAAAPGRVARLVGVERVARGLDLGGRERPRPPSTSSTEQVTSRPLAKCSTRPRRRAPTPARRPARHVFAPRPSPRGARRRWRSRSTRA